MTKAKQPKIPAWCHDFAQSLHEQDSTNVAELVLWVSETKEGQARLRQMRDESNLTN